MATLAISDVKHKTYVKVNEEGTEAQGDRKVVARYKEGELGGECRRHALPRLV